MLIREWPNFGPREEAEKRKLLTIVEDESRDHEEHQEEEKKGEIRSL